MSWHLTGSWLYQIQVNMRTVTSIWIHWSYSWRPRRSRPLMWNPSGRLERKSACCYWGLCCHCRTRDWANVTMSHRSEKLCLWKTLRRHEVSGSCRVAEFPPISDGVKRSAKVILPGSKSVLRPAYHLYPLEIQDASHHSESPETLLKHRRPSLWWKHCHLKSSAQLAQLPQKCMTSSATC